MDENLFELFGIKNDFATDFAKCYNLLKFTYFASQVTLIPQNDTFLYYKKNQISWGTCNCIILRNTFEALKKVI